MSLERVLKILESFGLQRIDAEVYVYLAKKGPKREKDLSMFFGVTKQQLLLSLKNLQSKGVVKATEENFIVFSAIKFEGVIDLFIKDNVEKACAIRETKRELLDSWQKMTE